MSQGQVFEFLYAQNAADVMREDLLPYCFSANVVGSVRRRKALVHDIELLLIPFVEPVLDMFGSKNGEVSRVDQEFRALVQHWGVKVLVDGPKKKQLVFPDGLKAELYISTPASWGVEMVVRTGPAEFSQRCVTQRNKGGYLPSYCQIKNGWQVIHQNGSILEMPSEVAFLEFLELGWIIPEER